MKEMLSCQSELYIQFAFYQLFVYVPKRCYFSRMKSVKILISIIVLVVIGIGYFVYTNNQTKEPKIITNNKIETEPIQKTNESSSTQKTYRSESLKVEFKYSDPLVVSEKNGTIFASEQRYNPKYAEGGRNLSLKSFSGDIEAFIKDYEKANVPYEKITKREKISDNGQVTKEHLTAMTALGIDFDFIFVTRKNGNYVIDYNRINPEHLEVVKTIKDIE